MYNVLRKHKEVNDSRKVCWERCRLLCWAKNEVCCPSRDSARNESEQTDTLPTVPRKAFFSFFPKSHEISKITSILLTVGKELFKTV